MLSSGPNRGEFGKKVASRDRGDSGAITVLCPAGAKKKPPCAPTLARAAATGEPELFRQSLQQIPETSTHIHWRICRQSYRANRPVSCGSYSGTHLLGKKISLFHRLGWTSLKHSSLPVLNKINSKADNRDQEHVRSPRFRIRDRGSVERSSTSFQVRELLTRSKQCDIRDRGIVLYALVYLL